MKFEVGKYQGKPRNVEKYMFVQVLPFCIFFRLTIALTDMLLSSYDVCIDTAQHQVVSEESEKRYSPEVMFRRMEEGSQEITNATFKKMSPSLVIPDEGLVFCPIPKVI